MTGHTQQNVMKIAAGKARAAMALRGWKTGDLAKALGLAPGTVTNLICGTNRGKSTRMRIEDILGVAAWSTPEEFEARQRATKKPKPINS